MLDSPWRQQQALKTGLQRLIWNVRRMPYLRAPARRDAVEFLTTLFQQEMDALSQQKLPLPGQAAVTLEDVQKDTTDKTGEEAATEHWHATGS